MFKMYDIYSLKTGCGCEEVHFTQISSLSTAASVNIMCIVSIQTQMNTTKYIPTKLQLYYKFGRR